MTDGPRPAPAPALEDVARAAGVSRATVSRVVNGVRNVDPVIQEAVRRAVAVTGYTPNRAARSLVTRRADAIALVVSGAGAEPGAGQEAPDTGASGAEVSGNGPEAGASRDAGRSGDDARGRAERQPETGASGDGSSFTARVFADPFFGRVVTGVVNHLRPRGMHPVLMFAESSRAREEVVAYLRQGGADGALVVSTHAEDPLPALIAEAGPAAVLFARPVPVSYVDLAHQDGARLAAEHLLGRGCRRIATISGPLDVPAGHARLTGFRDTMAPRAPVHPHRRGAVHPGERGGGDGTAAGGAPGPGRGIRRQRPDGAGGLPRPAGARPLGAGGGGGGRLRRQQRGPGLPPAADHGPPVGGGDGRGDDAPAAGPAVPAGRPGGLGDLRTGAGGTGVCLGNAGRGPGPRT